MSSFGVFDGALRRKSDRVLAFIDNLTFTRILTLWFVLVVFFGLLYYLFSGSAGYLYYGPINAHVDQLKDAIYFSFVAATTTGFGDIVPFGWFKALAIIEVVLGLMLLALVISKVVSIKQDVILSELYEISSNERVNRMRSSLLLFRQNLDRVTSKFEDGTYKKRDLKNIHAYIASLEDILNETKTLMAKPGGRYIKTVDAVHAELIMNSILSSFEKIEELISVLTKNQIAWETESNKTLVANCMRLNEELFANPNVTAILRKDTLNDLNSRKNKVADAISKIPNIKNITDYSVVREKHDNINEKNETI